MSTEESDQVVQRRANLDALKQLGVDPYPKRFEADDADQPAGCRARRKNQ